MSLSKKALELEMKRRALAAKEAAEVPLFKPEEFCFPEQLAFANEQRILKVACTSRRAGKCLIEGTKVLTKRGLIEIQNIKIGDIVFGYNKDGSISETKVLDVVDKGIKDVVDVKNGRDVIVSATKEHPFLIINKSDKVSVNCLQNISKHYNFLATKKTNLIGANGVPNKYAYALGAFLADRGPISKYASLDCNNEDIIGEIEKVCGPAHKVSYFNFIRYFKSIKKDEIPHFKEWIGNKPLQDRTCDISEVVKWDRESQLKFLAGLVDVGGIVAKSTGRIVLKISTKSRQVATAIQDLIQLLFQIKCKIYVNAKKWNRKSPLYYLKAYHNSDTLFILKELGPHLKRRKNRPNKRDFFLKTQVKSTKGFGLTKISAPYKAQCWDLEVDNETHLYMIENGVITHNTNSIIADFGNTCLLEPGVVCLYITLTMRSARSIIWGELKKVADLYKWDVSTDETRLEMYFNKTKSKIVCGGAKDEAEIEKYRGWKLRKAYVDECQSFRPHLKVLINEILLPGLRDLNGQLGLTGTPGPVLAGPFYEYCSNRKIPQYHWNAFDNPHMHNPDGEFNLPIKDLHSRLAEERELRGISETDPSYIRETFGKWVEDKESLVFKFSKNKNVYQQIPTGPMDYIFGIDIGWNDADAIAVLAYNYTDKKVYLIEEVIRPKQIITDLANIIKALRAQYSPIKMVMDAGALGKKIQEEIRQRHSLNIEAAEKNRKLEYIELLNDDLRTGKLMAPSNSRFEQDCMLVSWEHTDAGKRIISDAYHSDINDAVLYAWRECKHYIETEVDIRPPSPDSAEYSQYLEDKEMEKWQEQKESEDSVVSMSDLEYIYSDNIDDW